MTTTPLSFNKNLADPSVYGLVGQGGGLVSILGQNGYRTSKCSAAHVSHDLFDISHDLFDISHDF